MPRTDGPGPYILRRPNSRSGSGGFKGRVIRNVSHPPPLGFPVAATAALPGRSAGQLSRMCETTGGPVIGSACYGFECSTTSVTGIVVTISTVEVARRSGSTAFRSAKMRCCS